MDVTLSNNYIKRLVARAVEEDLGPGDITTEATVPRGRRCQARIVAKQGGVLAGIAFARAVFEQMDPAIQFQTHQGDAFSIQPHTVIAELEGPAAGILSGERVALNFLGHLSGIATLTAAYVEQIIGTGAKILDTRKTLPGLRLAQKYAVAAGGGVNHRIGLHDMVLIKDNHRALAVDGHGGIEDLVAAARKNPGQGIVLEVDDLEQFAVALEAGPDIVMLDNMPIDQMKEAVALREEKAPDILLEASGNVTLQSVRAIAQSGVDRISVGAITHSAPALDVSLDMEPA